MKFWRENAAAKLEADKAKTLEMQKYRIDQARARAEEKADQEHRLQMQADPDLLGASPQEKAAHLDALRRKYLLQEGLPVPPAQQAPRTVVRTGAVNSGSNKGKKATEYSDGTVEYQ